MSEESGRKRLAELPVLFFDWDGVCNHGEGFGCGCDVHNLDHLWWIREQTGCRLVCVSERRLTSLGRDRVRLMLGALPRVMVDWLEWLPEVSVTNWRAEDIAAFIAEAWRLDKGVRPGRWMVLDDELSWYEGTEVRRQVMEIDRQVGLTLHDALRAVRVLNGELDLRAAESDLLGSDGQISERSCHE